MRAAVRMHERFFAVVAFTLPHGPSAWAAMQRPASEIPPYAPTSINWPAVDARRQRQRVRQRVHALLASPRAGEDANRIPAQQVQRVASLTWVDEGVAQLLKGLQKAAVENSTLVVFTADHGESPKYSCLPGGLRVPFVLRWPDGVPSMGPIDGPLVSHLDLVPTLLHAAIVRSERQARRGRTIDVESGHNILPALLAHPTGVHVPGRTVSPCETFFDRGLISDTNSTVIWRALETGRLLAPAEARAHVVRESQPASWYDKPLQLYLGPPRDPSTVHINQLHGATGRTMPFNTMQQHYPDLLDSMSALLNASALPILRHLWLARQVWTTEPVDTPAPKSPLYVGTPSPK